MRPEPVIAIYNAMPVMRLSRRGADWCAAVLLAQCAETAEASHLTIDWPTTRVKIIHAPDPCPLEAEWAIGVRMPVDDA